MANDPTAEVASEDAQRYRRQGWWRSESLGELVRQRATDTPDSTAYFADDGPLSWSHYDRVADRLAGDFAGIGLSRGSRVAVYLPEGPLLHVLYTAMERAGLVIVGIPERAGDREIAHLLERAGAELLVCPPRHRGRSGAELVTALLMFGVELRRHCEPAADGKLRCYEWAEGVPNSEPVTPGELVDRRRGPDELWLLNSTSGTTGLPKCVRQFQNRWYYLAATAGRAARLDRQDVLMSLAPSPFGFGLWSAHMLPAMLGVPCVLRERFDPADTLRALAEHRVTVLACVTTQLVKLLGDPVLQECDLSALRVVFTGGERVPPDKAREWERLTGSTVLQFYGSNEIGPFACTTLDDDAEHRRSTVGRVVPGMDYRLYGNDGRDITDSGGPGQPGGRGPGACGGYWDDAAADAELYSDDGYLLLPDLATIDDAGYVRLAGRVSDLIIRGGKNISVPVVESEVAEQPLVDSVAVVPVPDPVFGERVCAVVTPADPTRSPRLDDVVEFLRGRGISKELFPEYLVVVDELPLSAGGKVAKQELKDRLPELLAAVDGGE